MSKTNAKIVKKYTLVSWQDADVVDQIVDRSFGGKLAAAASSTGSLLLANKENKPEEKVRKKRVSKRVSAAAASATAIGGEDSSMGMASSVDEATISGTKKSHFAKVSNHFIFGNAAGASNADGLMGMGNKTSNNKLDQSHRISYVDMCEVIKLNQKKLGNKLVDALNKSFERDFFPEWFRLMRFVHFRFLFLAFQ
jgi:hypothetical protein